MPAQDTYHNAAKNALVKDGWTITHDPLTLSLGKKDVHVDLGAEMPIAAEKAGKKIAVEIKSFVGQSDIRDFEVAVGQYAFYRSLLSRIEPERELFLAVPDTVYENTFTEAIARPVLEDLKVTLFTFDPQAEEIVQWIH